MTTAVDIEDALNTRLAALTPAWQTAWTNVKFTPTVGTQFQRASLTWDRVSTAGIGGGENSGEHWRGHLTVACLIPANQGSAAAIARADTVMDHFYRGLNLTSGSTTIVIEQPFLGGQIQEPDWFGQLVWIPWFTNVHT